MTLEEIRKLKQSVERQIESLLIGLSTECGAEISRVDVDTRARCTIGTKAFTSEVQVHVELRV